MIKQKTVLEVVIGERKYELFVSPDSPLGELFDALSQMRSLVVEKINESAPKESKESTESVVNEEPNEEKA